MGCTTFNVFDNIKTSNFRFLNNNMTIKREREKKFFEAFIADNEEEIGILFRGLFE